MAFSKVRMGSEEIFEVVVKDPDGRTIEKWTVMKRDFGEVVRILQRKFGLGFKIISKKQDRDLDWAYR